MSLGTPEAETAIFNADETELEAINVWHVDRVILHSEYGPLPSSYSVQRGVCVEYGPACVMKY